ncbi:MAG: hypothetical protein V4459_03435 [Pseudomonadota bacterium]
MLAVVSTAPMFSTPALAEDGRGCVVATTPAPTGSAPKPFALPFLVMREEIDPTTIVDDDFRRNRAPDLWRNLSVQHLTFQDGRATWRLWRIVNTCNPNGPLWVVPHDNENAAFDAAVRAVRTYGGVAVIVDTGAEDRGYAARFNTAVSYGPPIDPNRNFLSESSAYVRAVLADLGPVPRPIIALHTNAPGFDPASSNCPAREPGGSGNISILLCNAKFMPVGSSGGAWPFDDPDSLAIIPFLNDADRPSAFCAVALRKQDYNVVFEHVTETDGSLSNYSILHGYRYVNFETRDRSDQPNGLTDARNRLDQMIDGLMAKCLGVVAPARVAR